jgi:hypothetical protein
VSCSGLGITIWNAADLTQRLHVAMPGIEAFGDFASSARLSADGRRVVVTTSEWMNAGCWDVETGERLWITDFGGGNPQLSDAEFIDGDRHVLLRGYRWQILDARTGLELTPAWRGESRPLGASAAGRFVFAFRGDGVEIRDAETLAPTFTYVPCTDGGWRVDEHPR